MHKNPSKMLCFRDLFIGDYNDNNNNNSNNNNNLITAINTWAIPAISYGFSVINLTKTDLHTIDTKTRNLMRKFHIVHIKTNVERLYLPRNKVGRGLISLWKHF